MTTGHVLMGLLASGERHGYDLKREHDERFAGGRPLAFGQVYATLDRLQKKAWVEPVEVERVDGPDRTVFRLTVNGRAELDEWLSRVEEPSPHVSNPLAVKATIALLVGDRDQAARYLADQRAAHLTRMRHYTRLKVDAAATLPEVLAADYALVHLDADLQWLDLALDRITALNAAINGATEVNATDVNTSEINAAGTDQSYGRSRPRSNSSVTAAPDPEVTRAVETDIAITTSPEYPKATSQK